MAIIKMKRLHLLALRSDREELLHTLQRMGCVEISEPAEADGRSDAPPGDWEGLTAVLELRTPDGSALTLQKAADSCPTMLFGTGFCYQISEEDNAWLWSLFHEVAPE